jgi:hypothetical protein
MAIHTIPVRGTEKSVEIDSGKFSDAYYSALMQEILELKVNKRSTKFGPMKDATETDLLANANERVQELYEEKARRGGKKAKKGADSAVETEMLRIAKLYAKEQVRQGNIRDDKGGLIKVSKVSAAEWTRTAKAYIEADSEHFRKAAEANLAAASGLSVGNAPTLTLNEDPKLVKRSAEAAAKKKAESEAKKSGKVAPPPVKTKAKGVAKHN